MTALAGIETEWEAEVNTGIFKVNRRHLSHISLAEADIAMRYIPMKGVSGDYYDLLPLYDGSIGLTIGDVCGKGMRAAFLTASIRYILRKQVRRDRADAGEILSYLNRLVCNRTSRDQFVTMTYGTWNTDTHTFTYSSAGHPPILHYQADKRAVERLDMGGIVLGVCEDMAYPTGSVFLAEGDALVLYTDGITEASNPDDEVFGIERLREIVYVCGDGPSDQIASAIMDSAMRFSRQKWQDDITLLVVKRSG